MGIECCLAVWPLLSEDEEASTQVHDGSFNLSRLERSDPNTHRNTHTHTQTGGEIARQQLVAVTRQFK